MEYDLQRLRAECRADKPNFNKISNTKEKNLEKS